MEFGLLTKINKALRLYKPKTLIYEDTRRLGLTLRQNFYQSGKILHPAYLYYGNFARMH